MELNPLSIKESMEYQIPTFIFNLPTYEKKYDNLTGIVFLTGDPLMDSDILLNELEIENIKI
jgi:hypothetical protein